MDRCIVAPPGGLSINKASGNTVISERTVERGGQKDASIVIAAAASMALTVADRISVPAVADHGGRSR